jgi:phosphate transport system permease protein
MTDRESGMRDKSITIMGSFRSKNSVERAAGSIFAAFAFIAVLAVFSITLYMIVSGTPAVFELGLKEILFGTVWRPTGQDAAFGILHIILTSLVGTLGAILIGVPIGVMTAVFLAETAPKKLAGIVRPSVELLAGIPSVIYGLMGILILNPLMYQLELAIFKNSPNHQFTGGSNLISAVLVLAIMILPTVISISEASIRAVPQEYKQASLALGATRIQTVFKVILPAARSGIVTAIVLGVGRAIGEAMAISMVAGNGANLPLPFHSVRFLTTAVVSEMSYATDLHKRVLFTIGLVLFVFIMLINLALNKIMKGGRKDAAAC